MWSRWWEWDDPDCVDQVANAKDSFVDLTPISEAPAEATRTNWAALIPGQAVPMIGEQVYDDAEPCYDE